MRRPRSATAACCALLGAFALAVPASALAGSAGDQQYNDPFAGGGGSTTTTTHSSPTATTPPMPATTPTTRDTAPTTRDTVPEASTPPATTTTSAPVPAPAPGADSTVANAAVDSSTGNGPTATIAGGPSAGGSSATLPYTGYDAWAGAGFGAAMVAAGLVLRLRTRRS